MRLIMRSSVVLPHPEDPTNTVVLRDGSTRLKSLTAVVPSGNCLVTLRNSITIILRSVDRRGGRQRRGCGIQRSCGDFDPGVERDEAREILADAVEGTGERSGVRPCVVGVQLAARLHGVVLRIALPGARVLGRALDERSSVIDAGGKYQLPSMRARSLSSASAMTVPASTAFMVLPPRMWVRAYKRCATFGRGLRPGPSIWETILLRARRSRQVSHRLFGADAAADGAARHPLFASARHDHAESRP